MISSGIRRHKLVALDIRTVAPSDRYIATNRRRVNIFCRQHHCRCRICVPLNRSAPANDQDHHFCTHNGQQIPNSPRRQRIWAGRRHRCTIASIMVHGSFYRISYIHLIREKSGKYLKISADKLMSHKIQRKYSLVFGGIRRRYCVLHCCYWCRSMTNNSPWFSLPACLYLIFNYVWFRCSIRSRGIIYLFF